jgi:hypothetical protein
MLAPHRISVELTRDAIAACAEAVHSEARKGRTGAAAACSGVNGDTVPTCHFTPEVDESAEHIVLALDIQIKCHDGRRIILSPAGTDLLTAVTSDGQPVAREHLIRAIGLAFAWHQELVHSSCSFDSIAERAGVSIARIHGLLNLTRLNPAILRSALTGSLASTVTLADLASAAQHFSWPRQR